MPAVGICYRLEAVAGDAAEVAAWQRVSQSDVAREHAVEFFYKPALRGFLRLFRRFLAFEVIHGCLIKKSGAPAIFADRLRPLAARSLPFKNKAQG